MNRKLKLWEKAALSALCLGLLGACWAHGEKAELEGKVIRLHVVAVSDSEEEQAIKLRVRDAVLDCLAPMLEGTGESDAARESLRSNLDAIAAAAADASEGRQVTVTLGRETYPARRFEGGVLPAGDYESLRVILGEGEGHNWWGVLYPQLCLPAVEAGAESEALRAVMARDGLLVVPEAEGVELRFFLLDCWSEICRLLHNRDCEANKNSIY